MHNYLLGNYLLAEMSAEGWAIIIGAIFFGITKIVSMMLEYYTNRAIADKVEAVRKRQIQINKRTTNREKIIARKVQQVKKATIIVKTNLETANEEHKKHENVSLTMSNKLEDISKVTNTIHDLANSKMGLILLSNAKLARRLSDISKDSSDKQLAEQDLKLAESSEALYVEHQAKQIKTN